jgi:Tfp pilus assembly PilM family ATPase
MARILAIDWDRKEARALVLSSGPTGTSVAGVWAARLDTSEGAPLNGKQIGARLAEVMGADAVGKATTIVGVARDNVQIKLLNLPPAPDNELPDLVRFQAEREFTTLGSEAALDFIPLSGSDTTPHTVLAVALSPAGINEAREVSQAADLEPDRITVRALAAVSFVMRAGTVDSTGVALVVNPLADEADLSVVDAGRVVLMRTVRLPDSEQAVARQRTLSGEIRRTIAAARQQAADRPVDKLVMCGSSAGIDKIDGLGEDLGIPVMLFDPVTNAPAGLTGTRVPAESLSRFSAVLGMALSEADRKPPIVDFLNVRRKVEKQRFTRTHVIAAAAAAVLVLAAVAAMWRQSASVSSQLVALQEQIKRQEAELKNYGPHLEQHAAVAKWKATDANWLEVLARVSETLRPKQTVFNASQYQDYQTVIASDPLAYSKDVFVKSLLFTKPAALNAQGGEVQLRQAIARDRIAAIDLQSRVRSDPRGFNVKMGEQKEDRSIPNYTWGFSMNVSVEARDESVDAAAASTSTAPSTETRASEGKSPPTSTDNKNSPATTAATPTDARKSPDAAKTAAAAENPPPTNAAAAPSNTNPPVESTAPSANEEKK